MGAQAPDLERLDRVLEVVAGRRGAGEVQNCWRFGRANPTYDFAANSSLSIRVSGLEQVTKEYAGKPILTAQQVEDVIAYLQTLR